MQPMSMKIPIRNIGFRANEVKGAEIMRDLWMYERFL